MILTLFAFLSLSFYHSTTLPRYHSTTLPLYHSTTLPPSLFNSNLGHVIICGSANQRPIVEFMQELFHPDHRNPTLQVIILTRGPPSRAVLRLLNSVKFRARTTYLDGDVVATLSDQSKRCW